MQCFVGRMPTRYVATMVTQPMVVGQVTGQVTEQAREGARG